MVSCDNLSMQLEHPHTVPEDGVVGLILVLTTVSPHTDSLVASTNTKVGPLKMTRCRSESLH